MPLNISSASLRRSRSPGTPVENGKLAQFPASSRSKRTASSRSKKNFFFDLGRRGPPPPNAATEAGRTSEQRGAARARRFRRKIHLFRDLKRIVFQDSDFAQPSEENVRKFQRQTLDPLLRSLQKVPEIHFFRDASSADVLFCPGTPVENGKLAQFHSQSPPRVVSSASASPNPGT